MRGDGDRRDAIGVEIAQALGHTNDRLVLSEQRIELAERAIGNQDGLRQIAWVDHNQLGAKRDRECEHEQSNGDNSAHGESPIVGERRYDLARTAAQVARRDTLTVTSRIVRREAIKIGDLRRSGAGGTPTPQHYYAGAVRRPVRQCREMTEPVDHPDSRGRYNVDGSAIDAVRRPGRKLIQPDTGPSIVAIGTQAWKNARRVSPSD